MSLIINDIIQDDPILIFMHLIKYSQKNVNMFHYDSIFFLFPYTSFDFCFMYICFFVTKMSNGL